VTESIEALERRLDELRAEVRRAAVAGDRQRARALRAELRRAEADWEDALAELEAGAASPRPSAPRSVGPSSSGPRPLVAPVAALLPLREQVHHVLTLLGVPTAARMIVAVHQAFFTGEMVPARLTSLRRDEERSFRLAPHARPYYLCAALTADRLAPARGLLALSTWSMAERIVGPLSPRVHYLTAAIRVAEYLDRQAEPRPEASRLLWRFAANIPGADATHERSAVVAAARDELIIHEEADLEHRRSAARRANRMSTVDQLFGVRLAVAASDEETG
jgi:hypothetical protein